MKAKDLIEYLKTQPAEAEVWIKTEDEMEQAAGVRFTVHDITPIVVITT